MENHKHMKGYIYKITSPSNKIYIGQTIDIDIRKNKYKYLNCKNQTRLYRSLLKYGWENHVFEIIETIETNDINQLNSLEIEWISKLDCFNTGLNCTLGGHGTSGRKCSKETKLKMRNSQLGKKQSIETIAKRVVNLVGKKRDNTFKEKLRKAHTGKILSEETKEKIRKHNIGKVLTEEHRQKITEGLKRRYQQKKENKL